MKSIGYLIVSNYVAKEGRKIKWLYRESPTEEMDSGWRILSGAETNDYADNPDNFAIYSIDSVLAFDKNVKDILLNGAIGSEYELGESGTFVKIKEN